MTNILRYVIIRKYKYIGNEMANVGINEFKNGMKLLINNEPWNIIDVDMVKPGKGQAFTRIKIKNLKTGRVVDKTCKSTDKIETADVMELDYQYIYADGEYYYFMHPETYEQIEASKEAVADNAKWLVEESMCTVTLWNDNPIVVTPPNFVNMKIIETDPGLRGDTSSGGGKPAKLESGAVVSVPLFVQEGEVIKVDTRTGEYSGRAKK
ncbi:Translation elongation factor P [hydrothermal vent metagenome]|uniref:Translation elongation factor P n=1 Tax=hydrothermal vent metagenome TaxID=652676 RepID=A0A3B0W9S6_9ZZZZ